jgi:hypothetical protein
MSTAETTRFPRNRMLYLASGLAVLSAITYFIVAAGLAPGDPTAPPAGVMLLAGLAYLGGAGLILLDHRRLLMTGAVLNPLVIVAFFVAFLLGNADIEIVSLVSKLSQLGLQVVLLMLIRAPAAIPITAARPGDLR